MSRMLSKLLPVLLAVACLGARAYGSSLAYITVSGSEQQVSGAWDTSAITISFNGFVETVQYGQFSTQASIASAFAAMFSRDYLASGLCANASGATITFKLKGNATFGKLNIAGSGTSFQYASSGFLAQTASVVDVGTVTLTVNGSIAASANYGAGATPTTIAQGLESGMKAGSFVNLSANGDDLYLESKQVGSGTNYSYSIQTTSYDSTHFSQPSFANPAITGMLSGGANAGTSTGQTVYSYSATYDGVGNVASYNDSVNGNWDMTGGYDTLNRLTGAHATSGGFSGRYYCWTYDSFGNRTAQVSQTSACSSGTISPTVNYNAKNQVSWVQNSAPSGFSYDAAGNVTADAMNTYLYDGEGRICAVKSEPMSGLTTMTGYIYDADGTRVAKGSISTLSCDLSTNGFQTQSDYILGPSGEQMTEMTMDTDGSMYVAHNNVWAGGKLLATYDGDGALHFYLTDPLGSRRVMTNYAGVVEQNCQNLPFGDGENCGPTPTEHLFTGKERDQESGNDYFQARYYSSAMGRFMSPDWSAKEDPVPYANLEDPQSLNLYSYVRNNPLTRVDADGHIAIADDVVIGVAVGVVFTAAVVSAYEHTPEGQRNIQNLANTASENFSSNMHSLKDTVSGWFHKDAPAPEQTQHGATNEAKKDAGVPTSQQPSSQQTVPVTDSNGKQVVVDGKPQTSREQTHTTATGATVVIQVHGQGHTFPDGATTGAHVHVRPASDTRHGVVPGTKPHYPFQK
jgi:RHS repeat-associated protein